MGVVPIKGHYGSKRGTRKYATIYRTTSSKLAKHQPTAFGGGTRAAGWVKVAKIRTDALGKYVKTSVRVPRTTWYCVWYAGQAEELPWPLALCRRACSPRRRHPPD